MVSMVPTGKGCCRQQNVYSYDAIQCNDLRLILNQPLKLHYRDTSDLREGTTCHLQTIHKEGQRHLKSQLKECKDEIRSRMDMRLIIHMCGIEEKEAEKLINFIIFPSKAFLYLRCFCLFWLDENEVMPQQHGLNTLQGDYINTLVVMNIIVKWVLSLRRHPSHFFSLAIKQIEYLIQKIIWTGGRRNGQR